ncbi:MAG: Acetyltransferase, GNAT family, partial [uncultured Nocardioidaceae bacterium]
WRSGSTSPRTGPTSGRSSNRSSPRVTPMPTTRRGRPRRRRPSGSRRRPGTPSSRSRVISCSRRPRWARTGPGGVRTWRRRASWSPSRHAGEASDGHWVSTPSAGRRGRASPPCSSTRSWRPTTQRSPCGRSSGSRSSGRFRRRSSTRRRGASACTSCTGDSD